MFNKNIDEKTISKRIICSALRMEKSLADILNTEAHILRKKTSEDFDFNEIQKINRSIKYTLFFLTLMDDRIQKGMDMMKSNTEKSNMKTG